LFAATARCCANASSARAIRTRASGSALGACVPLVYLNLKGMGSTPMAFRPNYRFERAERDRLKQVRKDEKLKRQQERLSSRQDGAYAETDDRKDLPDT